MNSFDNYICKQFKDILKNEDTSPFDFIVFKKTLSTRTQGSSNTLTSSSNTSKSSSNVLTSNVLTGSSSTGSSNVLTDSSNVVQKLVGLENPSNTCYMNASLQCLIHTPMFVEKILKKENATGIKKDVQDLVLLYKDTENYTNILFYSSPLWKIFTDVWKGKTNVDTQKPYTIGDQIDTNEFMWEFIKEWNINNDKDFEKPEYHGNNLKKQLNNPSTDSFFNKFDETTKKDFNNITPEYLPDHINTKIRQLRTKSKKLGDKDYYESFYEYLKVSEGNDSILFDIFYLSLISKLNCSTHGISETVGINHSLEVSVYNPSSFADFYRDENNANELIICLNNFFKKESVPDRKCETYKNNVLVQRTEICPDVTRTYSIYTLPNILIIGIKRWVGTETNIYKTNIKVNCPDVLDMNNYISEDSPDKDNNTTYELYAYTEHSGAYSEKGGGGHYISHCKIKNTWYYFSDRTVCTKQEAIRKNLLKVGMRPYTIFYRRIKN